jgi:benzoylformate decarboxylase
MRGIQVFMDSLQAHGVNTLFGNPGTTENPLLDSFSDYPDMRYYVTLHEGVAVGAACFYALATGGTGVANVHVAPGLGNAIGMLYGALKANSPVIVTAGQQDDRMLLREPLLSHDLVAMAAPVTKWSVQPRSANEMSEIMRRAFKIANEPPMGPVFVALPINVMEQETQLAASTSGELHLNQDADPQAIERAVELLLAASRPAIIAGDDVAVSGSISRLVRLAEMIGAAIFHEGVHSQLSVPSQHPANRGRLAFELGNVRRQLAEFDLILMTDGAFFDEVWFDEGSPVPDTARTIQISQSVRNLAVKIPLDLGILGNLPATLDKLLLQLEEKKSKSFADAAAVRNAGLESDWQDALAARTDRLKRQWDATPMTPARALHEITEIVPDDVVVVDESITASIEVGQGFRFENPGDYFGGRGGGIGQGLAGVIGVKVACPDRPVIAISGDGSAMYSIQALWTAAHHHLAIVFIILSNREYRVLKHNLDIYRQRFNVQSNRPYPFMDLAGPVLNFVDLAKGMGVDGECVEKAEEVGAAIQKGLATGKPYLVEVVISGKV